MTALAAYQLLAIMASHAAIKEQYNVMALAAGHAIQGKDKHVATAALMTAWVTASTKDYASLGKPKI